MQKGALVSGLVASKPECSRVLRSRLAVRARSGGSHAGLRRVTQHCLRVARGFGMVRQPGHVGCPCDRRGQSCQRSLMKHPSLLVADLRLDSKARQLMAEGDVAGPDDNNSRCDALVESVDGVSGGRLEERQRHRWRRDCNRIDETASRGAQARHARKHSVFDALRNRRGAGRERLGHEERVSPGAPVQRSSVDVVRRRHRRHSPRRKRRHVHPCNRHAGSDLAEHTTQRVEAIEFVIAVADDHQRSDTLDASTGDSQHVERRAVCPVHVVKDDDDRRSPAQFVE